MIVLSCTNAQLFLLNLRKRYLSLENRNNSIMLGLILPSLESRAKFWLISKRSNFGYKTFLATNSIYIWRLQQRKGRFIYAELVKSAVLASLSIIFNLVIVVLTAFFWNGYSFTKLCYCVVHNTLTWKMQILKQESLQYIVL